MDTAAREVWREAVAGWAIPQELIDGAAEQAEATPRGVAIEDRPTASIAAELGGGGSILEVGGADVAIELAASGSRATAVLADERTAERVGEESFLRSAAVTRIVGQWPRVAGNAGRHAVVVSAASLYEVAPIGPYLEAMAAAARRAVVLEVTPRHPWADLSPYFAAIHGLSRPSRPTIDDLERVIEELSGVAPQRHWWSAPRVPRFDHMGGYLDFYRRRLLVSPEQSVAAAALLEKDAVVTSDGKIVLGSPDVELVTLWWRV